MGIATRGGVPIGDAEEPGLVGVSGLPAQPSAAGITGRAFA